MAHQNIVGLITEAQDKFEATFGQSLGTDILRRFTTAHNNETLTRHELEGYWGIGVLLHYFHQEFTQYPDNQHATRVEMFRVCARYCEMFYNHENTFRGNRAAVDCMYHIHTED